jgi:hypothetical protein
MEEKIPDNPSTLPDLKTNPARYPGDETAPPPTPLPEQDLLKGVTPFGTGPSAGQPAKETGDNVAKVEVKEG